ARIALRSAGPAPAASWDLATFTSACIEGAAQRSLEGRIRALGNRLLVEADGQGFPVPLLGEAVEAAGAIDWRQRLAMALSEVLHQVEQEWTKPTAGAKRWMQGLLVFLANWVPIVALLTACVVPLWKFYMAEPPVPLSLGSLLWPLIVVVLVCIALH